MKKRQSAQKTGTQRQKRGARSKETEGEGDGVKRALCT